MICVCGLVFHNFGPDSGRSSIAGFQLDRWVAYFTVVPAVAVLALLVFSTLDTSVRRHQPYLIATLAGLWASVMASLLCFLTTLVLGTSTDGRWLTGTPWALTAACLSMSAYFCFATFQRLQPPPSPAPARGRRWWTFLAVGALPVLALSFAALLLYAQPHLTA